MIFKHKYMIHINCYRIPLEVYTNKSLLNTSEKITIIKELRGITNNINYEKTTMIGR